MIIRFRYWLGHQMIALGRWVIHGRRKWAPVKDQTGEWPSRVFQPLPEDEAALLHDYGTR